jgi:hypothetical protein
MPRPLLFTHIYCTTFAAHHLERCTAALAPRPQPTHRRDRGQATTEYALVMLGAAAVALLVITWATAGGGAGRIGRLFDRVIDAVLDKV